MAMIRVVLVDDQLLFVESLKTVLDFRADDIEVVGTAHNGEEGLQVVRDTHPDIVLMDVRMPGMDGVEAARRLSAEFSDIKVVMLTTFDDDTYVREAMKYNAVGYLLKNIPPEDLIGSIRAVGSGNILLSPDVVGKILGREEHAPEPSPDAGDFTVGDFSRREREILYLISRGMDNTAIAARLFIAEQTVKNHISKIYAKLETRDRFRVAEIGRGLDLEHYCSYLD
jgi:DNA-binding NarL/FixJ family response regulator